MGSRLQSDDAFLAEIHAGIAATRATERDLAEHLAGAHQIRIRRADELVQHVAARFTSLAQAYSGAERGMQHLAQAGGDQDGLPPCHSLIWNLTQPTRKLEITISHQTGRYWLRLVRMEGVQDAVAALRCERDGDVSELSVEEIDALIRSLIDQHGW